MLIGGPPLDGPRSMWWNFVASDPALIEEPLNAHPDVALGAAVGLPDARRTVTLSTVLHFQEQTQVLCVDIHPDEVFGGQLAFPDTL